MRNSSEAKVVFTKHSQGLSAAAGGRSCQPGKALGQDIPALRSYQGTGSPSKGREK